MQTQGIVQPVHIFFQSHLILPTVGTYFVTYQLITNFAIEDSHENKEIKKYLHFVVYIEIYKKYCFLKFENLIPKY